MKPMNRRSFLGGAAASLAATAAPVMASPVTNDEDRWDMTYDLVVIGAGGAGLAAACEAVMQKMSVIVFEKEPIVGGSSTICARRSRRSSLKCTISRSMISARIRRGSPARKR